MDRHLLHPFPVLQSFPDVPGKCGDVIPSETAFSRGGNFLVALAQLRQWPDSSGVQWWSLAFTPC